MRHGGFVRREQFVEKLLALRHAIDDRAFGMSGWASVAISSDTSSYMDLGVVDGGDQ